MASTEIETVEVDTAVFRSILFDRDRPGTGAAASEPVFFGDLHLDQIVDAALAGREQYELRELFYRRLRDGDEVEYRHEVLRDLEREEVHEAVHEFAAGMQQMREHLTLADRLHYAGQKKRWFVEAISVYCAAVSALTAGLSTAQLGSRGFAALREYLAAYAEAAPFTALDQHTRRVKSSLAAVQYTVQLKGSRVRVGMYEGEPDMSMEIGHTFERFRQRTVGRRRTTFTEHPDMNHVEGQILGLVERLHPETFATVEDYCARHAHYLDPTIARFDREVQFYLAYLDLVEPLRSRGLAFCYPRVSTKSKEIHVSDGFDLALALKLGSDDVPVVSNDFILGGSERVLVVTGPNQGGKTTFARMFGQLHHLASLGLLVPGSDARLFLADQLFTHFEREEDLQTLHGKFEEELVRIHEVLQRASGDSVVIMNESFGATTLSDALKVGAEVLEQIASLDALCVFVTFLDELASLTDSTVSMMSTVDPDDPAVRTYKVVRKPADGLAYAAAIAAKYGLTYEALRRRIDR
jgi:DNA mismatch repair ATPase MutS